MTHYVFASRKRQFELKLTPISLEFKTQYIRFAMSLCDALFQL